MNPLHEDRIREELAGVSEELGSPIEVGREDQIVWVGEADA